MITSVFEGGMPVYTQEDFAAIDRQYKRRLLWCLTPVSILLIGLIFSFIARIEWLSVVLLIAAGALFIFLWDTVLSPVLSYRKFLRDLLSGRKRDYSGRFKGFENLNIMREGIPCRPFMLNVGDGKDEKDDRLLYWDIQHPLPEWHEGMKLWVSTFDKSVYDWRPEA